LNPQNILMLDDDFSLIKKFNEGEESAFRVLVARHKEKVRNLIYLILGNAEHIEDISQNVFIAVYKNLKKFRYQAQFSTWLHRITINKCRDHQRKAKLKNILIGFAKDDEELNLPVDFKDDFDVQELVRKSVASLPEKLKAPLILKDFEGYSYQDIAEILNSEVGTIKSRIFRAREGLRKILEPYKEELL